MKNSIFILLAYIFTFEFMGCHGQLQTQDKEKEGPEQGTSCAPAKYQANIWKSQLAGNSVLGVGTIKSCSHSDHVRCLRYYNPILERLSSDISELDTKIAHDRKSSSPSSGSSVDHDESNLFETLARRNTKIRQREGVLGLIRYHSGSGCTAQADTESDVEKGTPPQQAIVEAERGIYEAAESDAKLETS